MAERTFDDFFEETWSDFDPAVDDSDAAEPTAIAAAVPDEDATPEDDDNVIEAVATVAVDPFESDDNPYRVKAKHAEAQIQENERQRQLAMQTIARAEQIRQQNERSARIQAQVAALPNMDPDQLHGAVQNLLVEGVTPFAERATRAEQESEFYAKQIAIDQISRGFALTPEETRSLENLNNPLLMEQYAASMSQGRAKQQSELAEVRKQLAVYEKQEKARNRNRNADIVGGANGGPISGRARGDNIKTMDEFFEAHGI